MKKLFKNNWPIICSALMTLVILIGIFLWFIKGTNETLNTVTYNYLMDNSISQAAVFYTKLDDQMKLLESVTINFRDKKLSDDSKIWATILRINDVGLFTTIGAANREGQTLNSDGTSFGNIAFMDCFKESMKGKNSISKVTYYDGSGKEILLVTVPVFYNNQVYAVLYGAFPCDLLTGLIEDASMSDSYTNILLSKEGIILAKPANAEIIPRRAAKFLDIGSEFGTNGLYSEQQLLMALTSNKTFTLDYIHSKEECVAIFTPVGIHDWYLTTIYPKSIVAESVEKISKDAVILELACVVAFALLLFSILTLIKNNQFIMRSNEAYKAASADTKTIIYEYDILKRKIILNGNSEMIFEDNLSEIHGDDIKKIRNLIHEDDLGIWEDMLAVRASELTEINSEIRFKCLDSNYRWFRISGTALCDDKGKNIKFIGNVVDVEKQHEKESLLKAKAETDTLTGVLNKGAFQDRVNDELQKIEEGFVGALFIIDLDNFKNVNDTLGHAVGDRVLAEAAKKLCVVFSDKDVVGRIGGDEFSAFLKYNPEFVRNGSVLTDEKAKLICARINETYTVGTKSVNVSASVGVAIIRGKNIPYQDLYKEADEKLYEAKNLGKNCYKITEVNTWKK